MSVLSRTVLLFLVVAQGALGQLAVEENEVTLKQNATKPWQVGESICTEDANKVTRCGKVVKATRETIVLRLTIRGKGIELVRPRTSPSRQKPAVSKAVSAADSKAEALRLQKLAEQQALAAKTISDLQAQQELARKTMTAVQQQQALAAKTITTVQEQQAIAAKKISTVQGEQAIASRRSAADRQIAAESLMARKAAKVSSWSAGLGVGAGLDQIFPMIHFQKYFLSRFAAGIMPFYFQGSAATTQVTAFGAYFTTSYYFRSDTFRGPLAQAGFGYNAISSSNGGTSAKGSSLSITGILAWEFRPFWELYLRGGAGGLFAVRLSGEPDKIDYSGAYPHFIIEVGLGL